MAKKKPAKRAAKGAPKKGARGAKGSRAVGKGARAGGKSGRATKAGKAGKVALGVPAKGALAAVIPHASVVQFTANSRALLVARMKKKTLNLFDLETRTETPPLPALATFTAVALSADSRFIAMGTSTGIVAVQSTQTGKMAWKSKATGHAVGQVAFSLDGTLLFAVAPPPDGPLAEMVKTKEGVPNLKHDRWIRVFKTANGESDPAFEAVPGSMCCHLALSPDGIFLAHSELHSNSVLVWHLPTRQIGVCIRVPKNRGPVKALAFGLTVRHLFIAQQTQTTAWNAENGTQFMAMETPGIQSMAVIDHGATLAATRITEGVPALDLFNADSGRLRKTVKLPVKEPGRLAASPDGFMLALPTHSDCYVWHSERLLG